MNNTWNPDTFDMEAELARVREHWLNPQQYSGAFFPWQAELRDDPAKLAAKTEDWRRYTQGHVDKARTNMHFQTTLEEEKNYRFPAVTEENWHSLSWGPAILIEETPCLLLGTKEPITFLADCPYDPRLYAVQGGGYLCSHPQLHGVLLPLSDAAFRFAAKLEKKWVDSCVMTPAGLKDIIEYHEDLQGFDVDCNYSYHDFQEAWYPIDLAYLPKLVDIEIDDLRDWLATTIADPGPHPFFKDLQTHHDWHLVICGENCD